MIKLETARALKEAGLVWEPQYGDRFVIPAIFIEGITGLMDDRLLMAYRANELEDNWEEFIRVNIWLPRLDQLLAEIEKRGYKWNMFCQLDKYDLEIRPASVDDMTVNWINEVWEVDTPEEAAAQALLWILTEGNA